MRKITLRKRLLALMVCVFAWIGANAHETVGTTWIIYGDGVDGKTSDISNIQNIQVPSSSITTIKFVGSFPNGWDGTWFQDNGSVASKANITSIDLSGAILTGTTAGTIGTDGTVSASKKWGFSNFQNTGLTITWPSAGNITVIPDYAFKNCGMQSVTIPGYIETVCSHAFDSNSSDGFLKSIVFEEYGHTETNSEGKEVFVSDVDMYLGYQAFSNTYAVFDVYVETVGTIQASNMAFPEAITYGQGNTDNVLARLHFPDSKASDYVNQKHQLDQETANNDGAFQAWLVAHYTNANTEGNGWYEFVSNGSSKKVDSDQGDAVLFTFSHATLDYIVPKGAKAFIVGSVKKQGDDYLCELVKVNVIPHGTGVIIFGGTNSKSKEGYRTLEMTAVKYTGSPYNRTAQTVNNVDVYNLLVPTATSDGSSTYIEPYDLSSDKTKIEYRNFILTTFNWTESGAEYYGKHSNYGTGDGLENGNFVGFFRTKKGNIASGKAYLKCYAEQENNEVYESTCGEIIVTEHPTYRVEYASTSPYGELSEDQMRAKLYWYTDTDDADSKILWKHKWGTRTLEAGTSSAKFYGEPFFEEEENGIATMILPSSMVENELDGEFYTLQGVKVSQPSKGIYIKNGKKVVIK